MENISQLVESSLARHGVPANFDHLRLQWSNWFRCESSFSVLLAPAKPGIFALGEEVVPKGDGSKRMLALFQISDTDDLGMALGRLFLPGNPLRERLAAEHCFARYAVIEDPVQRQTASAVFQRWIQEWLRLHRALVVSKVRVARAPPPASLCLVTPLRH